MLKIALTVISSFLLCAIGIWKFVGRKKAARRELMKEASEDLENAHKTKNKSDILDAWDKSNRV